MKRWLVPVLTLILPALSLAAEVDQKASAAASGVGRAIGIFLFGYLVMKFMNRNKEDDGRPRGTSKILIVALVAVILLAVFH